MKEKLLTWIFGNSDSILPESCAANPMAAEMLHSAGLQLPTIADMMSDMAFKSNASEFRRKFLANRNDAEVVKQIAWRAANASVSGIPSKSGIFIPVDNTLFHIAKSVEMQIIEGLIRGGIWVLRADGKDYEPCPASLKAALSEKGGSR